MKIIVQVKAGAKVEKVEETKSTPPVAKGDHLPLVRGGYTVWVKAPAKEDKANAAVIKALARYFDTAKSNIEILSGLKSKSKVIEIG